MHVYANVTSAIQAAHLGIGVHAHNVANQEVPGYQNLRSLQVSRPTGVKVVLVKGARDQLDLASPRIHKLSQSVNMRTLKTADKMTQTILDLKG